jgi:hypothetical protein
VGGEVGEKFPHFFLSSISICTIEIVGNKHHSNSRNRTMIVNYDKAVEYLVEAYRNSLQDDGDFLADELNDDIGGGGVSVVKYNEDIDQLEVDDDQYLPRQLT